MFPGSFHASKGLNLWRNFVLTPFSTLLPKAEHHCSSSGGDGFDGGGEEGVVLGVLGGEGEAGFDGGELG